MNDKPTGKIKRRKPSNGNSTNSDKNPVDKPGFWQDPKNHFWERNAGYSQETKQYFRDFYGITR